MAEAVDDGRSYGDDDKARSLTGLGLSDQLIDPWCDLCYDHSSQKIEPDGFCAECNSFVCKPCIEAHKKVPALRNHRIMRGSKMPKSQADKPVKYIDCDRHDGNVNDQFCFDNGTMACSQCIRENHHLCRTKDISFICKDLGATDFQRLKDSIGSLKQDVVSKKSTMERNVTDIGDQQADMIKEAENMRDTLVIEIQTLCSKTISNIKDVCRQKVAGINDKVSILTDVVHSLDDAISDIDKTTVHANFGPNQFIRLQDIVNRARHCKSQIDTERKGLNKIYLSFSSAPEISAFFSKCNQLGNVKEVTSELDTLKHLPEITFPQFKGSRTRTPTIGKHRDIMKINTTKLTSLGANTSKDTHNCNIYEMGITSNGTLLLVDYNNKSMKAFSSDSKLLSTLSLDSPYGITIIDDTTAAVCTTNAKIHILDISNPAAPSVQNSVSMQYNATAVTTCNNNLVVISWSKAKCVTMIDLNGKELWSTSADHNGQPLFSVPDDVTTTTINNKAIILLVSDRSKDTLTALDASNGDLVRTIDVRGKCPHGLTTDGGGNVYVCYYTPREICVWSADLTQSRILLSGRDLLKSPRRIIYNNTTDDIIISYILNDTIDRFHLS